MYVFRPRPGAKCWPANSNGDVHTACKNKCLNKDRQNVILHQAHSAWRRASWRDILILHKLMTERNLCLSHVKYKGGVKGEECIPQLTDFLMETLLSPGQHGCVYFTCRSHSERVKHGFGHTVLVHIFKLLLYVYLFSQSVHS